MPTDSAIAARWRRRRESRRMRRLEIATAVLLSAAGLFSAWATYQASLWGGSQASHFARANAKVTEASRLSLVEGQLIGIDMMMFRAWLDAAAVGDEPRTTFFRRRFSPELRAVFDPWRARCLDDLDACKMDPDAPTAFPRPAHAQGIQARMLQRAAEAEFGEGDFANETSDYYIATTVVLSLVLFLAGISSVLKESNVRMAMLGLAALIGIAAAGFIFILPISAL